MPVRAFLLVGMSLLFASSGAAQDVSAFPGAHGFGASTPGGRGGEVIQVTNLEDSGPGSLRAAVEAEGPRIIVFRVAGIISLFSRLQIDDPYVTIAGQTAPGSGITLKNYGMVIQTHDVVVRYLRMRPGDVAERQLDALWVTDSRSVVIDHCSASWSIDETLSVTGSENVTVQWSFITESLNDSYHPKGEHGYGSLIRGGLQGYTFHHNLYAHHKSRSPRPGPQYTDEEALRFDFSNNAIYDYGARAGYNGSGPLQMNYRSNYLKPGPSTRRDIRGYAFVVGGDATRIYVDGNTIEGFPKASETNSRLIRDEAPEVLVDDPFEVPAVPLDSARVAFERILADAGATLPERDAVDERVVQQVREGTGGIINSQSEVGGWPTLEGGEPPADTDEDGMPDAWEREHDFEVGQDESAADRDEDGYTNVEEFLNGTDPSVATTPLEQEPAEPTSRLALSTNYPNPFAQFTTFEYYLPRAGRVTIIIHDVLGREVYAASRRRASGTHTFTLNAGRLPASGTYVCTLRAGNEQRHRMIVHQR